MPAAAVIHAGPVLAAEVVTVFVAMPPAPLVGKPAVNGVAVPVAAFESMGCVISIPFYFTENDKFPFKYWPLCQMSCPHVLVDVRVLAKKLSRALDRAGQRLGKAE
jgi:hypothetical protein